MNFAISSSNAHKGVEHLGIQVESGDELKEAYGRLRAADRPLVEEGCTTCCYAKSEKSWIADPDGVVWETFFTNGESTVYGNGPTLDALAADAACCDATTAQGECCDPKPELALDAPCCVPA